MGLFDLLAWAEASKASENAQDAMEKINAIEKKLDLIAQKLDELEAYVKAKG